MPIKFAHIRLTKFGVKSFWTHVDKRGAEECWLWTAKLDESGYGIAYMAARPRVASRVMWVITHNGDQPTGQICHHCDNRACVNPAHLYDGNQFDNMRDMVARGRNWQALITHCRRGHEYAGENLWIDRSGKRHCRECSRSASRRWWSRSGQDYLARKGSVVI